MKLYIIAIAILVSPVLLTAQTTPKGINENAKAPMFSAKDQNGETFDLSSALEKGPVVLVFYRGQWCPYCNKQLAALQDSLEFIKAKGATLIAVSPEKLENIKKTVAKTNATYPVIFDEGLKIMKGYDVAYSVDQATIKKYKGYGIDFNQANGDNGATLPVPAVYIINQKGIISFKHFDPDYSKRVSVSEILTRL